MQRPAIENSERGITLNKSLAWAIMVALVTGGAYMGRELATTKENQAYMLRTLETMQVRNEQVRLEDINARNAIEARLRFVETSTASDRADISGLRREMGEFRRELREAVEVIRAAR